MRINKVLSCFLLTIFTGSVFLTSGKFVNETNTPKFYFVVTLLLIMGIVLALRIKQFNLNYLFDHRILLWGVYLICIMQSCYGLCQYIGWLPSNHSKFAITGSFDNSAGFAAILSVGFPVSLLLIKKSKEVERYLVATGLTIIAISVLLSGSRAGMLAIVVSSLVFFLLQPNSVSQIKRFKFHKLVLILSLAFLIVLSFLIYNQKKGSAHGRILIWKVSSEMIKDKPILGHGFGAFQAKYMDYQTEYFRANQGSAFEMLADNVKHPFNEFIKVAVEFGMIGLAIVFSFVLFIFWKIMKSKDENRGLVLSGLVSFMVFASFSYPLQYVSVWLFLAFYLLALLQSKEIRIRNTPVSIIARIVVVVACTFPLFHFTKQIQAEIRWKTIAVNSLRGNTEKMLPEYEKLYSTSLKQNPYFLYNYGAELNIARKFDKSIDILTECQQRFNDYDLQILLADNFNKKGETEKAIEIYRHSSFMIPCRFLPIYQLLNIYRKMGQKDMAIKYASEIVNKKVKIPSLTINLIKSEAEEYLKENEITFGNTW